MTSTRPGYQFLDDDDEVGYKYDGAINKARSYSSQKFKEMYELARQNPEFAEGLGFKGDDFDKGTLAGIEKPGDYAKLYSKGGFVDQLRKRAGIKSGVNQLSDNDRGTIINALNKELYAGMLDGDESKGKPKEKEEEDQPLGYDPDLVKETDDEIDPSEISKEWVNATLDRHEGYQADQLENTEPNEFEYASSKTDEDDAAQNFLKVAMSNILNEALSEGYGGDTYG